MPWFLTPHGPHFVVEPGTIDEYERRDYVQMTAQQAVDYFAGVAFPDPPSFATEAEVPGIMATVAANPTSAFSVTLRAAFVRLAPAPTGVAAIDDANLRELNDDLANTVSEIPAFLPGGYIRLQPGRYRLLAPLPPRRGVHWEGVAPAMRQQAVTTGLWLADGPFDFEAGTVLEGDGTFAAFEANTTDLDDLPAELGATEIPGFGAVGIGFDNFTYGIHAGAKNTIGLTHGALDQLFFKRCNAWAVKLVNFAHMTIGDLRAVAPASNGAAGVFHFGASLPITTFQPGNTTIGELYAYVPHSSPKTRGIQFHAEGDPSGGMAHVTGRRIQCNRFGTVEITDTATFASGSSNVTVTGGDQFAPGMLVQLATAGHGFAADRVYVVRSVAGDTLTLADTTYGPAITATGSGALPLSSYGMANVEWTAGDAGSSHTTPQFLNIDSEGVASAGLYAEQCYMAEFGAGVTTAGSLANIVLRGVQHSRITCLEAAVTDFDATTMALSHFNSLPSTIVPKAIVADYTLIRSDAGKVIECFAGIEVNVAIPPDSSVNFPIGTVVEVYQGYGAQKATIVGGTGVTVVAPTGAGIATRAVGSTVRMRKRDVDYWVLSGDLG